jgi:hypothetical protein
VTWLHDFQPCSTMVWDFLQYCITMVTSHNLADVTIVNKAYYLLYGSNDLKQLCYHGNES